MLKDKASSAIVAVNDIERARYFYRDILGLDLSGDGNGDVLEFHTGPTKLIVYRSAHAGGNRGNAVVWGVGEDLDDIVALLKSRGVSFEHYSDLAGTTLQGDVHVAGAKRLVWLKDPAGNILHLNNM